ncbi:MAG: serine protease [Chitinophagaceae bacterium]|nr:trypsin-like peptidase domain-containing protein [Chitinophagaceae bacterium]MCB0741372.1 trypsin-like peptidase domain-containing protein [Chitinophagaceae bacterium]HQV06729.1 serine protease [Chitinophagaceae bacterium]
MKRLIFILTILLSIQSFAQEKYSPVQIAERNKPGTVMIEARFSGTVTAILPQVDEQAARQLVLQIQQQLQQSGQYTKDLFWNMYIKAFCANAPQYIKRGTSQVTKDVNTGMMGSGFIISDDGYVVTNAHVVDENAASTKQIFAQQAFQSFIEEDIQDLEQSMGRKMTKDESDAVIQADGWYYSQNMVVSKIEKQFGVVLGVSGDMGEMRPRMIPASVVTQGEPIPGKDVAILKLGIDHVYPTVKVGDDKEINVGENVYVLGYPGAATFHPLLSQSTISEATLTRGLVSAKKNMKDGWQVLQIDAAITHGNSGGPVFNEEGEVIGLATFGSIDNRGLEIQGLNFVVPVTIVKEFFRKADVTPAMSKVSTMYNEALENYDKAWYKKALKEFKSVKELYSAFPFVDQYISKARKSIDEGKDKSPGGMGWLLYVAIGVAVLGGAAYFLRKKKPAA